MAKSVEDLPRIARVSQIKCCFCFPDFGRTPGPGHLPLDSGRGDVISARVFAPVASVAVTFVSEFILWNLV